MSTHEIHIPISDATGTRVKAATRAVLESAQLGPHRKPFGEALVQMANEGIDYLLLTPIQRIELQGFAAKIAAGGAATARKGFAAVINGMAKRLDDEHLRAVAAFVDEFTV